MATQVVPAAVAAEVIQLLVPVAQAQPTRAMLDLLQEPLRIVVVAAAAQVLPAHCRMAVTALPAV